MQTAFGIIDDDLFELRFQSAQAGHSVAWIKSRGRIAWRNESGTVAGIEFLDPSPEIVREIRNWLSFGESLQELRDSWGADQTISAALADAQDPARPPRLHPDPFPEGSGNIDLGSVPSTGRTTISTLTGQNNRSVLPIAALMVAITVCCIALGTKWYGHARGHLGRSFSEPRQADRSVASTNAQAHKEIKSDSPTIPSEIKLPLNSPIATLSPSTVSQPPTIDLPLGSVLQAAAMSDEQNAKEFAQSLRQKNLPAFVSKRSTDRFYRVLIGPFRAEQLDQARSNLKKLAIKTISKPWSP